MDTGGHVVVRSAPETVEDPHRRCGIALGDTEVKLGVMSGDSWTIHLCLTGIRTGQPWAFCDHCQMHGRTT